MPGPAPKDPSARRRRNVSSGKTVLPAGGRTGVVPEWPLAVAEPSVWVDLWRRPQAVVWERNVLARVVARYAMLLVASETPDASAAILGEVRQLEDRLGLNPKAMRSLLWEVTEDEVAEKRGEEAPSKGASKRAQLKIVG